MIYHCLLCHEMAFNLSLLRCVRGGACGGNKKVCLLLPIETAGVQIAEQTPLNGLRIGQLALEAGIPPGVLNVIPGKPRHSTVNVNVTPTSS